MYKTWIRAGRFCAAVGGCMLLAYTIGVVAQDDNAETSDPPATTKDDAPKSDDGSQPGGSNDKGPSANEQFSIKLKEWKELIKHLRNLRANFEVAEDNAEADKIRKAWDVNVAKGRALIPQLRAIGEKAFREDPSANRNTARFLLKMMEDDLKRDLFEDAYALGQLFVEKGLEQDEKEVDKLMGVAAFMTNDFETAKKHLEEADKNNQLFEISLTQDQSIRPQSLLAEVDKMIELWKKEQELREAEKDDDLPRVKLETTKGDIVLELFENEAPGTVGNFISLVEKGFYDGLDFHRVLPGFMAQTGCPVGDGSGGPDYEIYCECYKPEARKHFRGSVSMAHPGGRRNAGGSQFFIMFSPKSHLNGIPEDEWKKIDIIERPFPHTVFGRVVEGMDVLAKLQRRDPANAEQAKKIKPDKIIKAVVTRKDPDKKYVPDKVKE